MTNHANLASTYATQLEKIWVAYRKINEASTIFTLLTLAHQVLQDFPTAVRIHLCENTDNGDGGMGWQFASDRDDTLENTQDYDDAWEYVSSLNPSDLDGWDFWVSEGTRRNFMGHLVIANVIDVLTPLANALVDPMPDPQDTAAVTAWLRKEIA